MKKVLVLATAMSLVLSGCVISVKDGDIDSDWVSDWETQQEENRTKLAQLAPGMTVAEVRALMGTADFNEFYQRDNKGIQVLYYRTHRAKGDGKTTKNECTPVVFTDGKVTGWGATATQVALSGS